ncbi:MAG: PqqD family protein [Prevotella sp.]|nr:PqqD family protein [Prevotella sp.]
MRIKNGFMLRDICGEKILIAEGQENIDFTNIISMNESSAYLWQAVEDKEFDVETLTHLLTEEYEVDEDTARKDSQALIDKWLEVGVISV